MAVTMEDDDTLALKMAGQAHSMAMKRLQHLILTLSYDQLGSPLLVDARREYDRAQAVVAECSKRRRENRLRRSRGGVR